MWRGERDAQLEKDLKVQTMLRDSHHIGHPWEKIHKKGEQQSRTTEEAGRKEGRLMKF